MSNLLVHLQGVSKKYHSQPQDVLAVNELSLKIREGELVALMGPSGSGKSTLLNLIGGLDKPSAGLVAVNGSVVSEMPDRDLDTFRLETIGFIFQQFHLMPNFTVAENIALTAIIRNRPRAEWIYRVIDLRAHFDIIDKIDSKPKTLSGGQQQRVAVCRALFAEPKVILADEPTGNLDSKNSEAVLSLLRESLRKDFVTAGVLVTHDAEAAAIADRVLMLRDGEIVDEHVSSRVEFSGNQNSEGGNANAQRIRAWIEASSS